MSLAEYSAGGLAKLVRGRALKPSEVVTYFLDRVQEHNPKLNCLIHLDPEKILSEVQRLDASPERNQAFFGIPLPIKELTEVKGSLTTYGSRAFSGFKAPFTRTAVKQLMDAGFMPFGSSTSSEFGASCFSESLLNGITRNPWDLNLTPGGSSGGGASALSAGMIPIAHGSDGGGSLRIPAAWCGVVGFKPSRGVVTSGPRYSWSMLSTQGVMTRNIEDQALVYDIWNQPDLLAWSPFKEMHFRRGLASLASAAQASRRGKLRVGILRETRPSGGVDQDSLRVLDEVAAHLKVLGYQVLDYDLDRGDTETFIDFFQTLWASLIGAVSDDPSQFEPTNQWMWEMSRRQSAMELFKAQNEAQFFSRRIVSQFASDIDFLVTLAVPTPPPKAGLSLEISQVSPKSLIDKNWELSPMTPWVNVTGQPAISLPLGRTSTGLPVGIQVVGAPFQDASLLQLAYHLEETLGYPDATGKRSSLAPLSLL